MASIHVVSLYPSPEARDESLMRLTHSGFLLDDESRMKTRDGRLIDVVRSIIVRHNPDGSVLGYQTVYRDITEQKAEQALRESEEKYRQLFDQSVAPISLFSADDGHFIEANDAWFHLLGYSRDDMAWVTPSTSSSHRRIGTANHSNVLLREGRLVDDPAP